MTIVSVCLFETPCERLTLEFALQRYTAPTVDMMVWGAIAYNTCPPPSIYLWHLDSPAIYPWHSEITCVVTHETAPRSLFSTRPCSVSRDKGVKRLFHTVTTPPWPA
ncbi:hypothetical protein TNCV_2470461 [Trichonephila clavipes]|nr:hypothetical protein TNCV_2470461 [Trichonephila clavipes]